MSQITKNQNEYQISYEITRQEVCEGFAEINGRYSTSVKYMICSGVVISIVYLLYQQYCNRLAIYNTITAIFGIVILFYILYAPIIKARRTAAYVAKAGGKICFTLNENGEITLDKEVVSMGDYKRGRMIETERLYVIHLDKDHNFILPKRIMSSCERKDIFEVALTYVSKYQNRQKRGRKSV